MGSPFSISGTATYYAGGGGASYFSSGGTYGTGGSGGGGGVGVTGTPNTGGGGGGGATATPQATATASATRETAVQMPETGIPPTAPSLWPTLLLMGFVMLLPVAGWFIWQRWFCWATPNGLNSMQPLPSQRALRLS